MRLVLVVYNTLMLAALCLFCPLWIPLVRFRQKYRKTFFSRLWMAPPSGFEGSVDAADMSTAVWIHALSVGEVLSAEPLVKALARQHGVKNLVFTASTRTGVETARRVIAPHVRLIRHFPYDTLFSVNRALAVIRPRAVVIVETDLWPNFLCLLKRRRIPVYLVNARLSGRSYRGYKRIAFLMVPLLSIFRRICVQAERDRHRFIDLGLPDETVVIAGNMKFDQPPVDVPPKAYEQLQAALGFQGGNPVWVAGSTHPHEEKILGKALQRLCTDGLIVDLIVVPRDPDRAGDVCDEFCGLGLQAMTMAQLETQKRLPGAVMVVDRLGILRILYALADVTFVGGSLVNAGGHNPLEPASVAKPILFGPYTDDFDWISRTLEKSGGARRVANEKDLSDTIRELLLDDKNKNEMGQKALAVLNRHQGAVARTMAIINVDALSGGRIPVQASSGLLGA
ncbi:WaaA: 3-deoxy-D-manno-octulosonic-acid transferase [Desulfosarcina variabilis str. Montpellier]|uniref:3-deoxy-D-manno-octulosonic acid transferase n=1 Tax=Desulfosarcina variabilis TaxID=2300 RepID=UPI003AFACE9D